MNAILQNIWNIDTLRESILIFEKDFSNANSKDISNEVNLVKEILNLFKEADE
jgi:hypothetical protein